MSGADIARGRAMVIAHKMQLEAAFENKPNHVRHVQNQIDYANAVAEAYNARWEQWVKTELPKMIGDCVDMRMKNGTIEAKVDEKSLQETKKKITEMLKSIFH